GAIMPYSIDVRASNRTVRASGDHTRFQRMSATRATWTAWDATAATLIADSFPHVHGRRQRRPEADVRVTVGAPVGSVRRIRVGASGRNRRRNGGARRAERPLRAHPRLLLAPIRRG